MSVWDPGAHPGCVIRRVKSREGTLGAGSWKLPIPELKRVLTRFVLKYTLRAQAEPSGAHEAVEGGTGHARDLGDGGLGNAQFEEAPDIVLLAIEP